MFTQSNFNYGIMEIVLMCYYIFIQSLLIYIIVIV